MKYVKPKLIKILGELPPVTVNFAQPSSQKDKKEKRKTSIKN